MKLEASVMRSFPLFADLSESDFNRVAAFGVPRLVQTDSCVFEQGESATHFYFLVSGRLKVTQISSDGQQIIVRMVNPGDIFGFAKALQREDYPGTSTAVLDSVVVAWPVSLWRPLIQSCPHLAISTLNTIGSRLEEAHTRIREMSTQEVEQRIAQTLLRLIKCAGRKDKEGIKIDFPLSRQDLAEMTGSTLHYVSRILSAWEGQNIIWSGRRKIVVLDTERLRNAAMGRT